MSTKQKEQMLQDFEAFEKSLEGKSLTELQEVEAAVIVEIDEVNTRVAGHQFKMKKTKGYEDVYAKICMFLDKQVSPWQTTKSFLELYKFWDTKKFHDKLAYPILDTTLRVLGQLQFTGHEEWQAIVDINDYFEQTRDEYTKVTEEVYRVAQKHQAVMQRMEQLSSHNQVNS